MGDRHRDILWSALASGLEIDVAFTVAAMFGASAAAIASIVHMLLTRIRRQNRHARLTATLAASVARAHSFEEDLPEILSLTSSVLGDVPLAMTRVDPERIVVPLGEYEPARARRTNRAPRGRRARDPSFDEEILVSVVNGVPYVLLVGWQSSDARRRVQAQTVAIVRICSGTSSSAEHIATLEERTRGSTDRAWNRRFCLARRTERPGDGGDPRPRPLQGYNDAFGRRRRSAAAALRFDGAASLAHGWLCSATPAVRSSASRSRAGWRARQRFVATSARRSATPAGSPSAGVAVACHLAMEVVLSRADGALSRGQRLLVATAPSSPVLGILLWRLACAGGTDRRRRAAQRRRHVVAHHRQRYTRSRRAVVEVLARGAPG
jgi:hypothetical protein